MKRIPRVLVFLLILGLAVGATSCKLLHEKVIEIVLKHYACLEYDEYETTANFADPRNLDVADEVDEALDEIGLTRDDIVEAKLLAATYEVLEFEDPGHDWLLSGGVLISYGGSTETIVSYTQQSIRDAMGGKTYATLVEAGVELFNEALYDYYANGLYPVVTFSLTNDAAIGDGGEQVSELDPLDFLWEGCMKMYIIIQQEPDVIDPF